MTWAKIDDHLDEHPKIARAGPLGFAWYVAGILYSHRNLTDGFIPEAVARTLLSLTHEDSLGEAWTLSPGQPLGRSSA